MSSTWNRRDALKSGAGLAGAALAAGVLAVQPVAAQGADKMPKPRYCLNTSTIRGQKLSLVEEVDIASRAGYDGIEPWIREIDEYTKGGGSLKDLHKRIEDAGLTVDSAIGFAAWIVVPVTTSLYIFS